MRPVLHPPALYERGPNAPESRRVRVAHAVDELLRALGYALEGEIEGTGRRVADAWLDELVAGEGQDPAEVLRAGAIDLGEGSHGIVVLRDLHVATMCPHHLLPSHGRATVGFLPDRRAAGLGAIAAMVDVAAKRLVLQETLGVSIAHALMDGLSARGAFCRLELTHTCFVTRGERQTGSVVDTLAMLGAFENASMREVAMALLSHRSPAP